MIKAIAFDPGKTTGFATGEIVQLKAKVNPYMNDVYWEGMLVQTAQALMSHADIMNWLNEFKPDYIICERFDFRNRARTGLELISREFIGVINLYCEMNSDCTLVMQQASQIKGGYWSDAKLKKHGVYRKPIEGVSQIHANEACKHLLYWYKFGSGSQYGKEFELKQQTLFT